MTLPGETTRMPADPTAPPADTLLVPPSAPSQPYQPYQPNSGHPQAQAAPSIPGYPYAAAAWPQQPSPYSGWAQPQPAVGPDPAESLRKARTALGWAIGAAVGALLALVLAVVAMFMSGAGLVAGDGMFYESLRGEADGVTDGTYLPGSDLEASMTPVLLEWYFDVEDLSCPDTKAVTASTAVVCTGELDGLEWTGVVFFEDTEGSYVILEL